ncbi:MAG TPA: hypothetical protein VM452_16635 [Caulifigura sp.]|nr:hypothetical protein [Caulifigura sp.]
MRRLLLLGIVVTSLTGCGPKGDPSSVTGTVTLDGTPLAKAYVEFYPQGGSGNLAVGYSNAQGVYEARISSSLGGATIGDNLVRISTKGEEASSVEKLPAKYNKKSELHADVKPGPNTINFELQSDGGAAKPAAATAPAN